MYRSFVILLILSIASCKNQPKEKQLYDATWESIQKQKVPDWFYNAKFGIYFHWGIYSVPAYKSEWYPHYMYLDNYQKWGGDIRPHHIATYGEDFQYHDFIPMFTAEHFDAREWAELFKASGAKYAGPVAEHSDNFSMWDSKVNPWNAAKMGPKRDIVGELEDAIKAEGLKFVTTFHHQYHWGWYANWSGLVDTSTAELRSFYGETTLPETFRGMKKDMETYGPTEDFVWLWKEKVFEVIEAYKPDLLWFDSRSYIIPEQARIEVAQRFYNSAIANNKEVVLTYKKEDFPKGTGVLDIEGGRLNELVDYPWLTDACFTYGAWCYTKGNRPKGANMNIDALIDIVSKNGCLLLNIGPRADGTIPEDVKMGLLEMGGWLKEYGEAIYSTKPFIEYGEGPTELWQNRFGGYDDKKEGYCSSDFRYTTRDDKLYIIQLDFPEPGEEFILNIFAKDSIAETVNINSLRLLGTDEEIIWKRDDNGLHFKSPATFPNEFALVYVANMN